MTLADLRRHVSEGESETQEFKKTTGQRTDGAATVCAMLNHRGGRVLFGIISDGNIAGQQVSDKTLEDLARELQLIEPSVLATLEQVPVGRDYQVIVVTVPRGSGGPYTYKGKCYRRVGASNIQLTREEYHRLVLEAHHGSSRWETQPDEGWTVDDLDVTEIIRTLEEAVRRGRAEDPATRNPMEILRGFGLVSEGPVLRAAVALFARAECLLPCYPQCLLRVARFKGTDKTEFLDNRQFHGNCFDLLLRAERFLRENLPIAGRIVPSAFERIDDPLLPPAALREALANALCHRDYTLGGGSVSVGIYDDRVEITSSGSLHFGLTAEKLFQPHDSLPWNPLIAAAFYRRGVIETWGRGTIKMAELMAKAGLPAPEIEEMGGAVVVRFPPRIPGFLAHGALESSARRRLLLEALGAVDSMTSHEIEDRLGANVSARQLKRDLTALRDLEMVESFGRGRSARWRLKDRSRVRMRDEEHNA